MAHCIIVQPLNEAQETNGLRVWTISLRSSAYSIHSIESAEYL